MDVRGIWPHEAHHFTPWLAKNLDLLGEALHMKLELIQPEAPVGPYYLDIQAKEIDRDVMVAIENQLEWTDFSHLGQLLTYATGVRRAHRNMGRAGVQVRACRGLAPSQRMDAR